MASYIFPVCVPDYREPAARVAELLWLCLSCDCGGELTAGALLVGWAAPGMRDYTAAWCWSNIMVLALCMVNGTTSSYGS